MIFLGFLTVPEPSRAVSVVFQGAYSEDAPRSFHPWRSEQLNGKIAAG